MTRFVVLNSSQSKQPTGRDSWIQATLRAVDVLCRRGYALVGSTGLVTWELALCRAARAGAQVHMVVVVPNGVDAAHVIQATCDGFGLTPDACTWHFVPSRQSHGRLKDAWAERDCAAIAAADCVVPVSIRPGGKLEALLGQVRHRGGLIETFAVPYECERRSLAWGLRLPRSVPQDLFGGAPALVHLTRAASGPWPGERPRDYYAELFLGDPEPPRSAFRTLRRIVQERRIRASQHRIAGRQPVVCFTQSDPQQALRLVRPRRRLARYAFEPYAVAIDLDAAWQLGARPVEYLPSSTRPSTRSFLHQGSGPGAVWRQEQEWRLCGDLLLDGLDRAAVRVIAATESEAACLRSHSAFTVVSFGCREVPRPPKRTDCRHQESRR